MYALEVGGASGTQTLSVSGQTLTVDSSIVIGPWGAIDMANSTLDGLGMITLSSGSVSSFYGSTIDAALTNNGDLDAEYTNTINGTYTSGVGSTLRVVGTVAAGNLTVLNGFQNNGAIELTNTTAGLTATLTVTNGTLTNASGRTIDALVGAGSAARYLYAQLDNQGDLTATAPLTISRSNAAHINSGTITLTGADLTMTLSSTTFENSGLLNASTGSLAINQSGAAPSFTNSGTLTIGTGQTVTATSGSFNYPSGGTINGPGTLNLNSVTADIDDAVLDNSVLDFYMTSVTVNGSTGSIVNAALETMTFYGSTFNVPVTNNGTLDAEYTNTINGTYTSGVGSTLRVVGTVAAGNLTVLNGFQNNGAIELTNTTAGLTATLTVTNGTLTNASGRTIDALAGAGTAARYLYAALDNQGTITVDAPLTLNNTFTHADNALLQGTSTFNISAATVTFNGDIEPGAAGTPGVLTVTGPLTLTGTSNVNIDILGAAVGTGYDQLVVSGALTIAGALNLDRGTFDPTIPTTFPVITYASFADGPFSPITGTGPFTDWVFTAFANTTGYDVTASAWP